MGDGTRCHQLVNERGWTSERYAAWLGQAWVDRLARPPGDTT